MDIRYIKLIYSDGEIRWYIEVKKYFLFWSYWTYFDIHADLTKNQEEAFKNMKYCMKLNPTQTQISIYPTIEHYLTESLLRN